MTAYRNDVDALAAREEVLARELAEKQRERDDVQRMLEEARAAEAAQAIENDVMVGRRRLRRIVGGIAILLVAGVAAGAMCVTHDDVELVAVTKPVEPELDNTKLGLALAAKGLTDVVLEPRFPTGLSGLETEAEVHAAVGESVEPWQAFTYIGDASARQAVASPLYRGGQEDPQPQFVTDGNGGVWRVVPDVPRKAVIAPEALKWSRKVWLLPSGSTFRGDLAIAYPR
jgi:hypothetical protein